MAYGKIVKPIAFTPRAELETRNPLGELLDDTSDMIRRGIDGTSNAVREFGGGTAKVVRRGGKETGKVLKATASKIVKVSKGAKAKIVSGVEASKRIVGSRSSPKRPNKFEALSAKSQCSDDEQKACDSAQPDQLTECFFSEDDDDDHDTDAEENEEEQERSARFSAGTFDIHPNAAFADEVRKRQDISESADQVEKLQSLLMSRANRSELEERKIYRSSSALDLSHGSSTLRATVGDDETAAGLLVDRVQYYRVHVQRGEALGRKDSMNIVAGH